MELVREPTPEFNAAIARNIILGHNCTNCDHSAYANISNITCDVWNRSHAPDFTCNFWNKYLKF